MATLTTTRRFAFSCLSAALIATPLTPLAHATQSAAVKAAPTTLEGGFSVNLKMGQVLEVVLPKRRIGRDARRARKTFDTVVVPELERQDVRYLGRFAVDENVVSNRRPSSVEFFSYRDANLKQRLDTNENWTDLQDYRSEGWKRWDRYAVTLPDDLSLTFDPSKYYTLAIAWANPANPEDYDSYLDGVETQFESLGARFMHKFEAIDLVSTGSRRVPPSKMIFVEWDTENGVTELLTGDAYRTYSSYFRSGVADFEFYRLSSPTPS